jgi:Asp-tRNA(Asn)/Glu-tRNA(Gln) amidotransferase A subunit family amidase
MSALHELSVAEAVEALHAGELTAEALVRACLDRIAAEEPRVQAWQHLDPDAALAQARRIDAAPIRPLLGGVPIGVKDIIDTADLPTECGSPIRRGRRPAVDAACVAALRSSGAVILGKTVTTEFAYYQPGKTRNPHDPAHTPGGSSSGSAAAVACEMVPAALGTQTAGSVIRPAAFCGVIGFKPSFDLLPMAGVLPFSPSLDTLGVFARALEDLPVLMAALGAPLDVQTRTAPPRVGLCRTDAWSSASPEAQALVQDAAEALELVGAPVRQVELPPELVGLAEFQKTIMAVEGARGMTAEGHPELMSAKLRDLVATGDATSPEEYRAALQRAEVARAATARLFAEVDVLLTPSTPGEAPRGLESTGDPVFNRLGTLLHLPCLNLPVGRGPAGLPLGLQVVGASRTDGPLLASAAWAWDRLRP